MLLAASDRDAERRPDDVRMSPVAPKNSSPAAILVDERLADVEEDGLQAQRISLQCLALEA